MHQYVLALSLLAAGGSTPAKVVLAIVALVAIMLAVGIVKGKIRQAERRVMRAGARKAASALDKRMTDSSKGGN